MPKIHCGVDTCSYNQNKVCCASIINVGGKGSVNNQATCCGSFLNRLGYSNLAQYTENRGDTDAILCKVDTCVHYCENHCSLNEIEMNASNGQAEIYTETDCMSFQQR